MIIEFWKEKEIANLYKQVKEAENLIKQFDLELLKIRQERNPTIKDFGMLCCKYKNKDYNKAMINLCYRRINFLKSNNINQEQYYRIGIY